MEEKKPDRRFVVCVRKDMEGLTYGKTYEVLNTGGYAHVYGTKYDFDEIGIIDDNGNKILPHLSYNYKEKVPSTDGFKIIHKKVDNFITLEDWRDLQLNKLLK